MGREFLSLDFVVNRAKEEFSYLECLDVRVVGGAEEGVKSGSRVWEGEKERQS
ncbi:MAG: hypothetical protein ABIM44_05710 [candidate division WOR-3 bacterium]